MKKNSLTYLFLLLLLQLSGCDSTNQHNLNHFIEKLKNKAHITLPALPTLITVSSNMAIPNALRDPFAMSVTTSLTTENMHHYALTSLRLVGTLSNQQQHWALLQTPNHTLQRVTMGQRIGKSQAKIIAIEQDHITLQKLTQQSGKVIKEILVLSLGK
ncbi:MAG: pilus assembly protein PilP [Gammaproteobacteria bacterium]|nr:pilus assembly protein PilP [Gammaproteobacteria bacterium]